MKETLGQIARLVTQYIRDVGFVVYSRSGPYNVEATIRFGESFAEWYVRTKQEAPHADS